MNNNNQPIYLNTWIIVLAFMFCWPVGVYLLILRTNANKKNLFDGQTTEKMCNIVGAILIIGGLGTIFRTFFGGLFYIAGGVALIYYGRKNKEKVARYKAYINLVVNQNVTSLDSISRKLNVDYSVVRNDIDTLIAKGTFKNATIDESSRSIILYEIPDATLPQENIFGDVVGAISGVANQLGNMVAGPINQNVQQYSQNVTTVKQNASMIAVKCPGCGATRRAIQGTGVECEYCGSIFNA